MLDRMLFWTVVRAYCICLVSVLSLYIIVDLFTNLEEFTGKSDGLLDSLNRIALYYGFRSIQYFDRLAEALALLSAMFTVAWMQRNNELLPILSSGVSTQRAIRPILLTATLFITLGSLTQELLLPIPMVANALQADRDDVFRSKDTLVQGGFDGSGIHVEGMVGSPREQMVRQFHATIPETAVNSLMHLTAATAHYVAPRPGVDLSGGWLLTDTTPADPGARNKPETLVHLESGKYFLRSKDVNFDAITRRAKWTDYVSTEKLYELLRDGDGRRNAGLAVTFHMRITRPIIGFLLVLMGLGVILRDQTRHVFISTGLCMLVCVFFYGTVFAAKALGSADYISPPLAAWLPVIIFGPLALSAYDAIHT